MNDLFEWLDIFNPIVGFVSSIIAIFSMFFGLKARLQLKKERRHRQHRFEWAHVQQGVSTICRDIKRDGITPDYFVAVPGAGIILTEMAIISFGEDKQYPIYYIEQKHLDDNSPFDCTHGVEVKTRKWRYWLPKELIDKKELKGLIFDDFVSSGDTLMNLKSALSEHNVNIVTAGLICNSHNINYSMPDYHYFVVDDSDVYMPWGHADKKERIKHRATIRGKIERANEYLNYCKLKVEDRLTK